MLVDAERKGVSALDGLVDDADDAAIAAVTVAELVADAELADGKRRASREAFLAEILGAISVEDYGLDVAQLGVVEGRVEISGKDPQPPAAGRGQPQPSGYGWIGIPWPC